MNIMKYFLFIVGIFLISNVFASNYSIEFTQMGNDLIVLEHINGNENSYVIEDGLEDTGGGYVFLREIIAQDDFDSFQVKLILEDGVLAKSEKIFPAGSVIFSDGTSMGIVWDYSNVSKEQEFAFFVVLQDNDYVWMVFIYVVAFIVSGFILFALSRILLRRNRNMEKYLLDEEKGIIEFLSHSDRHESWQRKIQDKFNLSKAKTSRLIRNLESRNLIEKIPFGNTNKIRLK